MLSIILAQTDPTSGWGGIANNLTALGILGIFILLILPRERAADRALIEKLFGFITTIQANQTASFQGHADKVVEKLGEMNNSLVRVLDRLPDKKE